MKRKLRTSIGENYQVGSIANPPSLDDVREDTKKSNKTLVAKMVAEIYAHSKNNKPLTRTKSPQSQFWSIESHFDQLNDKFESAHFFIYVLML